VIDRISAAARLFWSQTRADDWASVPGCDVLLVRHDADCGYEFRGQAYAHVLDSFGELCRRQGLTTATVAIPYSVLTGDLAYSAPRSFNREAARIALGGRLRRRWRGTDHGAAWVADRRVGVWRRVLECARPVSVVGIQPEPALCRSARALQIPVCDLQHGVITDEMAWYGAAHRSATPPQELPDTFLCWDEPSATTLRRWAPAKGVAVHVVGNPWFQRFRERARGDELVEDALRTGRIFQVDKPVVLHSLSWGMELYYTKPSFNGLIVSSLVEAILATADSWNWLLRLHPVQVRGQEGRRALAFLERTFGHLDSVDWRVSSELPLPVVLAQTDVHITDLSSIVIEAGWFGIRSALLNPLCRPGERFGQIYPLERARGLASVVPQDSGTIVEWLREAILADRPPPTYEGAGAAMTTFIADIAGRAGRRAGLPRGAE
jgi:hypothetical protein